MTRIQTNDTRWLQISKDKIAAKSHASKARRLDSTVDTFVTKWLLEYQKIDIDKLEVGAIIVIQIGVQDVFKIERKSANRVDIKLLQMEEPATAERFTRSVPSTYFDGLVNDETEQVDSRSTVELAEDLIRLVKSNVR